MTDQLHRRSPWTSIFKASVRQKHCERGNIEKLGGAPPIRMVCPPSTEALEDTRKPVTVTIKITETVKDTFTKFFDGNAEDALRHVNVFWNLERKLEYRKLFHAEQDLHDKFARSANKIKDDDVTRAAEQKAAVTKSKEHSTKAASALDDIWSLFERLLDPCLVSDWHVIVDEETKQPGWIAKGGLKKNTVRGRSVAALKACIRKWLLRVMKPNAAERHRLYMQHQICMPKFDTDISVFVTRLIEMNQYLSLMPCLKDVQDSPTELTRADTPFTEMELCTIITNVIPHGLQCAYWAKHATNHFPMSVTDLKDELVLLWPEFNCLQSVLEKVTSKEQSLKQREKQMNSKNEPSIPRKGPRSAASSKKDGWEERHCQLCAKGYPSAAKTHNTKDCTRFNYSNNTFYHYTPVTSPSTSPFSPSDSPASSRIT